MRLDPNFVRRFVAARTSVADHARRLYAMDGSHPMRPRTPRDPRILEDGNTGEAAFGGIDSWSLGTEDTITIEVLSSGGRESPTGEEARGVDPYMTDQNTRSRAPRRRGRTLDDMRALSDQIKRKRSVTKK